MHCLHLVPGQMLELQRNKRSKKIQVISLRIRQSVEKNSLKSAGRIPMPLLYLCHIDTFCVSSGKEAQAFLGLNCLNSYFDSPFFL